MPPHERLERVALAKNKLEGDSLHLAEIRSVTPANVGPCGGAPESSNRPGRLVSAPLDRSCLPFAARSRLNSPASASLFGDYGRAPLTRGDCGYGLRVHV